MHASLLGFIINMLPAVCFKTIKKNAKLLACNTNSNEKARHEKRKPFSFATLKTERCPFTPQYRVVI